MKRMKKLVTALLALCLVLSLAPAAHAEEDSRFKGKSWEEVMADFFQLYQVRADYCGFGYKNLVTGEEHYHNGDSYYVAASMYKVPLNMMFAEKVANGEMSWETTVGGYPYETLMQGSIIDSNNAYAETLWNSIGNGSYRTYRELMAPYVGEDAQTVDPKYYENNFSTPRQIIYALDLLYNNPDRFPKILDTMKLAEPDRYFRYGEHRYEIAHKYRFLQEEFHTYVNDCGIAFTDEPIAIVAFTDNSPNTLDMLTAYASLMCDYSQYQAARHRQLGGKLDEAVSSLTLNLNPTPLYAESGQGSVLDSESSQQSSEQLFGFIRKVALCTAAALLLAGLMAAARNGGHRILTILLGLVFSVTLLAAGLLNSSRPELIHRFVKTDEAGQTQAAAAASPEDTAVRFLDDLKQQNYTEALSLTDGYQTLGLEQDVEDPMDQAALSALRQCYGYELTGPCETTGAGAVQPVRLRYLNLNKLREAYVAETRSVLSAMCDTVDLSELQESGGSFKASVVQDAAVTAMSNLSGQLDSLCDTADFDLNLSRRSGNWFVHASAELTTALTGGLR